MSAGTLDIHIRDLAVKAGSRTLLRLDELHIGAGERVAIVGHNGAGKSTLLRVIGGLLEPAEGSVSVLGRPLREPVSDAALRAWRCEVGQVMQGLHMVSRLSARENVLIGALGRLSGWRSWSRLYPAALVDEANQALALVGLQGRGDARTDRLSGGERQKLSIARLRLQRPRLILADEPTANLDPAAAADACHWLGSIAPGATLITVVHQPALLPLLADRVIGLRDGAPVFDLPIAEVGVDRLQALYEPGPTPAPTSPQTQAPTSRPDPAPALMACRPTLQGNTP
ncbi:MAG: ATP-binding cassette domain-containing protein [Hydrogenophaga sp.]|uniref:phosphonate ABC transporter ATP-binding protein n=1 Tax=Hydrogenophaga sp. TaxID=1904254 RepID=UPI0026362709|nr:ATP-binding cassette domain-containing protein [Hydrogenophaga sp.]MDM7943397.1 ATP-binding cassette domain-containing protein [Hydrogenophaga sp.]